MRALLLGLCLIGCAPVPQTIDTTGDRYLERRPSPDALVDARGIYQGGWYESFTGSFNQDQAAGDKYNLKQWLHVNVDDPRFYVVVQMVRTDFAGNVAVVVTDKQTGAFHSEDVVQMFSDSLKCDAAVTTLTDPSTGSHMTLVDGQLDFDVNANGLRVRGKASEILTPPLTQIHRFHDGYGALGVWGNVSLTEGAVTVEGEEHALTPGALGLYDRTVGHQRTTLHWNYLATSGRARNRLTGEVRTFSVQGAIDRDRSRPLADTKNHGFWLESRFSKVEELVFDYELDPATQQFGPWHVHTPAAPGRGARVDLTLSAPPGFEQLFHRRNQSADLWIVERDFHQVYGVVTGTLELDGATWDVEPGTWALAEQALVVL
ncbi:MAG: DUF2804 family protein [Archangium sp.]|nr:DUF2804 family protein [Archangium sp.]